MAITIQLKPRFQEAFSVDRPIMVGASSTNSGESQYRFKCTVKISGGSDLVTLSVPPNDADCGFFDVSKICRDALEVPSFSPIINITTKHPGAKRFTATISGRYLDSNGDEQTDTGVEVDFHAFIGRNFVMTQNLEVTPGSPDTQETNWYREVSLFTQDGYYSEMGAGAWDTRDTVYAPRLSADLRNGIFGSKFGKDETNTTLQSNTEAYWLDEHSTWTTAAVAHGSDVTGVGNVITHISAICYDASGSATDSVTSAISPGGGGAGEVDWLRLFPAGLNPLTYLMIGIDVPFVINLIDASYFSVAYHSGSPTTGNQVTRTIAGKVVNQATGDNCGSGIPILIGYMDAQGAFQTLTMRGTKSASRTSTTKTFTPMMGNWNAASASVPFESNFRDGGTRPYAITSTKTFTINSGWIREEFQGMFEDLITSPVTYLIENGGASTPEMYRIEVLSKTIQRKTAREDKNISVTLTYREANRMNA